ncbi:MAG: hypothetical protein VX447_11840 [Pseudomonadota bacterium]|uniref:hypothetical protein n=1 Tax=Gallaecimonas pentaromativorans TaxID=584787 RepID=UPI00067EE477|nr:hypothetical protein [Gallaecimonas pentaromativorans]MED5525425.1 hypothetical protein [Pseudomonadota bacterium]
MEVKGKQEVEVITDVLCDICGDSTSGDGKISPQFAVLSANWGYGSEHDGEVYEVHFCESCFFSALVSIQEQRRSMMLATDGFEHNPKFGLILDRSCS